MKGPSRGLDSARHSVGGRTSEPRRPSQGRSAGWHRLQMARGRRASLPCRDSLTPARFGGALGWGRGRASGAEIRLPWDARGFWGPRCRGTGWVFHGAIVAPRVGERLVSMGFATPGTAVTGAFLGVCSSTHGTPMASALPSAPIPQRPLGPLRQGRDLAIGHSAPGVIGHQSLIVTSPPPSFRTLWK